ncbi:tetratricopeptide repeat protein [bacterium]|nr:tetratricopeptide repeat protein [bacterium]
MDNVQTDTAKSGKLYEKAVSYVLEAKYVEAIEKFQELLKNAVEEFSHISEAYLYMAYVYAKLGEFESAAISFESVTDGDGILDLEAKYGVEPLIVQDSVSFWKKRAREVKDIPGIYECVLPLLLFNSFEDCIEVVEKFLGAKASECPKSEFYRAVALYKTGRVKESAASLILYEDRCPEDYCAYYYEGVAQFALRDVDKAVAAYKKALELAPSCLKAQLHLAQAYMLGNQMHLVRSTLREAIKDHPNCAEAYFGLGECYSKQKRQEEALYCIYKASEISPQTGSYALKLGHLYKQFNQTEKALECYRRACKLMPKNGAAFSALGAMLCETGETAEAEGALEKAVTLKSTPKAQRNLASVYSKVNKFEKAADIFRRLLEADRDNTGLLYELGTVYFRSGNFEKAESVWEDCLQREPENNKISCFLGICKRAVGKGAEHDRYLLETIGRMLPADQSVYGEALRLLQDRQYERSSDKFDEASVLCVPVKDSDFLTVAVAQYLGSKAGALGMALGEEKRYSQGAEESFYGFMSALAQLSGQRDKYNKSHAVHTAAIADALASMIGLNEEQCSGVRIGACLHDVGKIALPDENMYSRALREDIDNSVYESHPLLGVKFFADMPFPDGALEAVKYHHECWDGSGFPDGLRGNAIHIAAQIVGLADFFERLLTRGLSGRFLKPGEAMSVVKGYAGAKFNPMLVQNMSDGFEAIRSVLESF